MAADPFLAQLLQLLGIGFLVANARLLLHYVQFRRLRVGAELTWPVRKPPLYGFLLTLGVLLGFLVFFKLVVQRQPPTRAFGESMMFLYYGYALPLSLRIGRGFYAEGIWTDGGFMRYSAIGGLSWRTAIHPTLTLIYRTRHQARVLVVPDAHYAGARRILRDKIAQHDIEFTGRGLDLGPRDARDVV